MKGPLLPLSLLLAVAATAALAFVVLRERPRGGAGEPPSEPAQDLPTRAPAPEIGIRPYETTATLTEDLRDALGGAPEALAATLRHASARLGTKARWTLANAAPAEASPPVRALLVFAAGVHLQDEDLLLGFLEDREPVVRRAAALAAAHEEGAPRRHVLVGAIEVPVGRLLPAATRAALEARLRREDDEGVLAALAAALSARPR